MEISDSLLNEIEEALSTANLLINKDRDFYSENFEYYNLLTKLRGVRASNSDVEDLKEGDRVEIIGGDSDIHQDWIPEMDKYIGEEATVLNFIIDANEIIAINLDIADATYDWSPQWVKKIYKEV